jgi:hypothetical protein
MGIGTMRDPREGIARTKVQPQAQSGEAGSHEKVATGLAKHGAPAL